MIDDILQPITHLPGGVHPVRNSSRYDPSARAGLEWLQTERGIISNGVNVYSYCPLDCAHCRPVRKFGIVD